MRNNIIRSILVLVLAFLALPMMGQDFMNIYFKDGKQKKFYLMNVTDFRISMEDADGVQHGSDLYQHINTPLQHFVFALEDIDSISFTKFDKEKVVDNLSSAMQYIMPAINECSTIDEAEKLIDQFKQTNGVADAWSDGHELFIRIKDWETISFHFNHDINDTEEAAANIDKSFHELKKMMKAQTKNGYTGERRKFAVVHQEYFDESPTRQKDREKYYEPILAFAYDECNMDTAYIKKPDLDFFKNDLWDYDIIILATHGGYDHSLNTGDFLGVVPNNLTNEEWKELKKEFVEKYNDIIEKNKIPSDNYTSLSYNHETRNEEIVTVAYVGIKESFFEGVTKYKSFRPYSILFNTACLSMYGENEEESISLAKILTEKKGLGVYLGYNQVGSNGPRSSFEFFTNVLNGKFIGTAYDKLGDISINIRYVDENKNLTQHNTGTLKDTYVTKFNTDGEVEEEYLLSLKMYPEKKFLSPTYTVKKEQYSVNQEYAANKTISLEGMTGLAITDFKEMEFGFSLSKTEFGFDPILNTQIVMAEVVPMNYSSDKGNVLFRGTVGNLMPGQTYYYRAFTYDGTHYNIGEPESFTIEIPQLSLSTNTITLSALTCGSVQIISGSGSYVIEFEDEDDEFVATAFIDGNIISINALNPGNATIIVSDKVTGQTATILVTVTGQADTRELMVTKTVNKTVFSIYKKTLDENDYRTNPDGWKCYRSELILDIIKEGKTESYVVDNNIYLDKQDSHHGGQQPCMLLDFNKNMIGIFCNPKGSGYNYEMDGYFYSSSMDNVNFSKETVFEGANWGWFPYFRDYGDDNIYLCNFSYGGYFTILAVRENGSWELYYDNDDISPEAAEQIWKRIGSVLVIGNTQDEDVDDRIHTVIPEEIRDEIEEYIPIYDGMNPPNIEDAYFLSPQILIGSSRSFDYIGSEYAYEYQKYSNQDMANNTIDMVRVQGDGIEWAKGSGAFISGTGNNFTIYFIMEGESDGIWTKEAYIVSGTKTASGIKDLTCGFILTEKGDDPDGRLVDVGTFRFFTDQDGMSETTSWPYGTQYGTRKRVKENSDRPNSHEKSHATLKHLKKP